MNTGAQKLLANVITLGLLGMAAGPIIVYGASRQSSDTPIVSHGQIAGVAAGIAAAGAAIGIGVILRCSSWPQPNGLYGFRLQRPRTRQRRRSRDVGAYRRSESHQAWRAGPRYGQKRAEGFSQFTPIPGGESLQGLWHVRRWPLRSLNDAAHEQAYSQFGNGQLCNSGRWRFIAWSLAALNASRYR